jgi:hypothetical protein
MCILVSLAYTCMLHACVYTDWQGYIYIPLKVSCGVECGNNGIGWSDLFYSCIVCVGGRGGRGEGESEGRVRWCGRVGGCGVDLRF